MSRAGPIIAVLILMTPTILAQDEVPRSAPDPLVSPPTGTASGHADGGWGWRTHGSHEPDTVWDTPDLMWPDAPPPATSRVYFNAVLQVPSTGVSPNVAALGSAISPGSLVEAYAYLGVWNDCNNDGYVGLAEGAAFEYPAVSLASTTRCPAISGDPASWTMGAHNYNGWVRELLWIGPADAVGDQNLDGSIDDDVLRYAPGTYLDWDALVWGDLGFPWAPDELCPVRPPQGTTASTGALLGYADCHINRRVANQTNFIDGEVAYWTGLHPARFDDPDDPATSRTLLNQDLPASLWGNPHWGPGQGSYQRGLLDDGAAPGGEGPDPTFTTWDCDRSITVDDDGLVDLPSMPVDALRGPIGYGPTQVAVWRADGTPAHDPTPDDRIITVGGLAPGIPIDGSIASRSLYDAVNHTQNGAVGNCQEDAPAFLPTPEGGASHSRVRRQSDLVFRFQGSPLPAVNAFVTSAPYDLGVSPTRRSTGVGWIASSISLLDQLPFRDDARPSGAQHATFYAHLGPATRGRGFQLPGGQGTYGDFACGSEDSGIRAGWDCDRTRWYRDETGRDVAPRQAYGPQRSHAPTSPWGGSRPVVAYPGQPYQLRDVDCFDGRLADELPVYASLRDFTEDTDCAGARGSQAGLLRTAPELDDDSNGIGDTFQRRYQLTRAQVEAALQRGTDFDGDGAGLLQEFRWDTIPLAIPGTYTLAQARDRDGDDWLDGEEIRYWDTTSEPVLPVTGGLAYRDPDSYADSDADGVLNQHDPDSDGDDVLDGEEAVARGTYPEYADSDCAPESGACPWPAQTRYNAEGRVASPGDGIGDDLEYRHWTRTLGAQGHIADCDNDGIPNIRDWDSDGDDISDGQEILAGTDACENGTPPIMREIASADPTNEDLPIDDATAVAWLTSGHEERVETVPGQLGGVWGDCLALVVDACLEIPEELVDLETLVPSPPVELVPDALEAPLDCAQRLALDDPALAAAHGAVECLSGVVANGTVELIDRLPLGGEIVATTDALAGTVATLAPIDMTNLPFSAPTPAQLTAIGVAPSPPPTGDGPTLPDPWGPAGWDGTPIEPLLFGDTPYPNLLGGALAQMGAGPAYGIVHSLDTLAGPVEIINTIDSTHFSLVVVDEPTGFRSIATNRALGVPWPINVDNDTSTGFTSHDTALNGADILVQAAFVPSASLTTRAQVRIVSLRADVQTLVLGFLQVPGTDHVLALGADGTIMGSGSTDGLPANIAVSAGVRLDLNSTEPTASTTVLRQEYVFGQETAPAGARTMLVAAAFRVDNSAPLKTRVPGSGADLEILLPAAPGLVEAAIRGNPQSVGDPLDPADDGLRLTWTASEATRIRAGARIERGDSADGILVEASEMPRQSVTRITRNATAFKVAHAAESVLANLTFSYSNGTDRAGGGTFVDVPRDLAFVWDDTTDLSFEASDPPGLIELVDYSTTPGVEPPCRTSTAEHFVLNTRARDADCLSVRTSGFTSVTVQTTGTTLNVSASRPDDSGQVLLDFDEGPGGERTFLDFTNIPRETSLATALATGGFDLDINNSGPIAGATFVSRTYDSILERWVDIAGRVAGLPKTFWIDARVRAGEFAAEASPEGVRDVQFRYNHSRGGATSLPPPTLGDADGFHVKSDGAAIDLIVARVRAFRGATMAFDPGTGIELHTRGDSTAPFYVNYTDDERSLVASLTRLPPDLRLEYGGDQTAFDATYSASDPIPGARGRFLLRSSQATAFIDVTDLPTRLEAHAKFNATSVGITAFSNAPVSHAEVALLGSASDYLAAPHPNFVSVDALDPVQLGGITVPSFQVNLTAFRSVFANVTKTGIDVNSTFDARAGLGARYRAQGSWFDLDSSAFPDLLSLHLGSTGLDWNATPGSASSLRARGSFPGFEGAFELEGIPSRLTANYTEIGEDRKIDVQHDGTKVDLIELAGQLALAPLAPRLLRIHAEDVPSRVHVSHDGATQRFDFTSADANGDPARIANAEFGLSLQPDAGWSVPRETAPGRGVIHLRKSVDSLELYARVPSLRSLHARLTPDPARGNAIWMEYDGDASRPDLALSIDTGAAGMKLNGRIEGLPTRFGLNLTTTPSFAIQHWASSGGRYFQLDHLAGDMLTSARGDLPQEFHLRAEGGSIVASASEGVWINAARVRPGQSLAFQTNMSEYVVVRPDSSEPRFAVNLTGFRYVRAKSLDAEVGSGISVSQTDLELRKDTVSGVYVDVYDPVGPWGIAGFLAGLPREVKLRMHRYGSAPQSGTTYEGTTIDWDAASATPWIKLWLSKGDTLSEVTASEIPPHVDIGLTLKDGELARASVRTSDTTSIGEIEILHAADGTRRPPALGEGQVLLVDRNGAARDAFGARLHGLRSVELVQREKSFSLELAHAAPRMPFHAAILSADQRQDIQIAALPHRLIFEKGSQTKDDLSFNADARGEAIGDVAFTHVRGTELLRANVQNVGTLLRGGYAKSDSSLAVSYETTDPPAPMRGLIELVTASGERYNATATKPGEKLPNKLTILAQTPATGPKTGTVSVGSDGSTFTGEFMQASPGARYFPVKGLGVSVAQKADNRHLWARVSNLASADWSLDPGGQSRLGVGFSTPSAAPFVATMEDDESRLVLHATGLPARIDAEWNVSDAARTRLNLSAATPIERLGFSHVNMLDTLERLDANLTPVPSELKLDLATPEDGRLNLTLLQASVEGTLVGAELRRADAEKIVDLGVVGLPGRLDVGVDTLTQPSVTNPRACVLDLRPRQPIGGLDFFLKPQSKPASISTFIRDAPLGAHRIGIDTAGGTSVYARASGLGDTRYCKEVEERWSLDAALPAAPELRFHLTNDGAAGRETQVRLVGIPGGAIHLANTTRGIEYAADGRIDAATIRRVDPGALDMNLTAKKLPRAFEFQYDMEGPRQLIRADTKGETLESLVVRGNLGGATGVGTGSNDEFKPLDIDFSELKADLLGVSVSSGAAPLRWPSAPTGTHLVTFDIETKALGVLLYGLEGANLRISPHQAAVHPAIDGGVSIGVTRFAVEDRPLRLRVDMESDGTKALRIRIENMPTNLLMNLTTSINGILDGSFIEVRRGRDIQLIEIRHPFGERDELVHRLPRIEGGHTIPISLIATATAAVLKVAITAYPIGTSVAVAGAVGAYIAAVRGPSTSFVLSVETPYDLHLHADLDGDTNYEAAPIVTIIRAAGATDLSLTMRSGDNGLDLSVPGRMKTPGTVLVKQEPWQGEMGTAQSSVNAEETCSQRVANPRHSSRYGGMTYDVPIATLRDVLCLS